MHLERNVYLLERVFMTELLSKPESGPASPSGLPLERDGTFIYSCVPIMVLSTSQIHEARSLSLSASKSAS